MSGSDLSDWPGADRRHVPASSATYVVRSALARWLRDEAARAAERWPEGVRVLDVGCGVKPYYPFFAEHASRYVGVDVVENPMADVHGPVEALPVPDGSFELVLCTQVLEHCDDPAAAVSELRRVTAPGGRVLASTHGVQVYHPSPDDLWRWTHAGLQRLFVRHADWAGVTVHAPSGTAACLGMLVSNYTEQVARRARVEPLGRLLVTGLNRGAQAIDGRARVLREPGPGTIHANYHVVAEVPL